MMGGQFISLVILDEGCERYDFYFKSYLLESRILVKVFKVVKFIIRKLLLK